MKVGALDVNQRSSDVEGATSDSANGGGESGGNKIELAPCSGSALGDKMDQKVMVDGTERHLR